MISPEPSDPVAFARDTASMLFDWDTTTDSPTGITVAIVAVADPTGQEVPGLLADLHAYLPDERWWQHLADFRTRQRLEVTTATVPAAWTHAVAGGQVDGAAPGTVAVTITGVRHRSGTVAGRRESTQGPVSFTMFIACPPDEEGCWLLRLGTAVTALE